MRKLLLGAALSMAVFLSRGQDDVSVPEPEFINQVFFLDKNKKLVSLEKTEAELKSKPKVVGGGKQVYVMNGAKSPVVIPLAEMMFVVSSSTSGFGNDPSQQFQLLKFENKKNNREAVSMTYGGMGGKNKSPEEGGISLNVKILKENVFGLVPGKALEKGEYAFINRLSMQGGMNMKMDAYAFSVE